LSEVRLPIEPEPAVTKFPPFCSLGWRSTKRIKEWGLVHTSS
jgi:hypothetical protein